VNAASRWLSGAPDDSLLAAVERDVTERGGRMRVEALALSGRAVMIEVRCRLETVEVWRGPHLCAVFDRIDLRSWLDEGTGSVSRDEATFAVDRAVDVRGRLSISIAATFGAAPVREWTLSPSEEQALMEEV
jgi:hypothetical protein